jgi:hypothetical protein
VTTLNKRVFQKLTGKKLDDLHAPTLQDIRNRLDKELSSKHPIRSLGRSSESEVFFTEESRESHMHILGTTGEGKSKFLEHIIRQDIDLGYGVCLIDGSENGDTCYNVLKYCAKKKIEKVCLIDPHHRYSKKVEIAGQEVGWGPVVPSINPLHEGAPTSAVVGDVMDIVRVLWSTSDPAMIGKIQRYFSAIIHVLHKASYEARKQGRQGYSLYDLVNFTDRTNPTYIRRRTEILDWIHPADQNRVTVESVFQNHPSLFEQLFGSTIRWLTPFLEDTMKLIIGGGESIDFFKMVSGGWIILVNLANPTTIWREEQQRLLGTLIINEIFYATQRLMEMGRVGLSGKGKPYYLYVDEVGKFATPKIAEILDYKRKVGLRLTVSHQGFDQIKDKQVLNSIYGRTKIKILFSTPHSGDLSEMMKMMFWGKLETEAKQALMQLKKQHAVIKFPKQDPFAFRVPDVIEPKIEPEEIRDYITKLYRQPWYHHPQELLTEINARFPNPKPGRPPDEKKGRNTKLSVPRTANDGQAARRTAPRARPQGNVEALFAQGEVSRPPSPKKNTRSPKQSDKGQAGPKQQTED